MRTRRVLFLCTGNYYRSRFAELLFNHHAARLSLPWAADSAALAIERGHENVGFLSAHTVAGLAARGLPPADPGRFPRGCLGRDLESADLVVALKEVEHRPYVRAQFPAWEERVEYWHVHDLDAGTPAEALAEIERLVGALVERCRGGAVDGAGRGAVEGAP